METKNFSFKESNGRTFKLRVGSAWYDEKWDYNKLYNRLQDICICKFYNSDFASGLDCRKEYRSLVSAYVSKTFLANAEESFSTYFEWRKCHYFYANEFTLWCTILEKFSDDKWFIESKEAMSKELWKEFINYQSDYAGKKWFIENGLESEINNF